MRRYWWLKYVYIRIELYIFFNLTHGHVDDLKFENYCFYKHIVLKMIFLDSIMIHVLKETDSVYYIQWHV